MAERCCVITRGDEITILVMTGGERGVYDVRSCRNEQQCAALLAGATLVWGGYKDGAVPQGPDAISVVDRVVDKYGAEVLYTHAPGDSHQDHRATSSICLAAARRVPTVLYYETPSTIDFVPTVFIDLEDLMERKIGLVCGICPRCCAMVPSSSMRWSRRRAFVDRRAGRATPKPSARRAFLWDLLSAPTNGPTRGSERQPARVHRITELRAISKAASAACSMKVAPDASRLSRPTFPHRSWKTFPCCAWCSSTSTTPCTRKPTTWSGAWNAVACAASEWGVPFEPFVGELESIAGEGTDRGRIIDRASARPGRSDVSSEAARQPHTTTYVPDVSSRIPAWSRGLDALPCSSRSVSSPTGWPAGQRAKLHALRTRRDVRGGGLQRRVRRESASRYPLPFVMALDPPRRRRERGDVHR